MTDQNLTPPSGGRGATSFAPMLRIRNGVTDIDFYKNAFGAIEHFRLNNDDGSVHVAEFDIDGAVFHIHEIYPHATFNPEAHRGVVTVGLFVDDVHGMFNRAIAAGAIEVNPVTDYEYGYRQGTLKDPFGHEWILQCRIPASPDWEGIAQFAVGSLQLYICKLPTANC